jgi:hypothetical protein
MLPPSACDAQRAWPAHGQVPLVALAGYGVAFLAVLADPSLLSQASAPPRSELHLPEAHCLGPLELCRISQTWSRGAPRESARPPARPRPCARAAGARGAAAAGRGGALCAGPGPAHRETRVALPIRAAQCLFATMQRVLHPPGRRKGGVETSREEPRAPISVPRTNVREAACPLSTG